MGVGVELSLVDDAGAVGVEELDWVLDRHDVFVSLAVDLVDHRRECGRFSRSSRSGNQNQTAWLAAQLLDDRRQTEFAEPEYLVGNLPKRGRDRAALMEDVRAEPGEAFEAEREVEFEVLFEPLFLLVGEDRVDEFLGFGGVERRVVERRENAVDPDLGRGVRRQMEVRRALAGHLLEHLVQSQLHMRIPTREASGYPVGGSPRSWNG